MNKFIDASLYSKCDETVRACTQEAPLWLKFNSHDFTFLKFENPSSHSKVKIFSKYGLKYPQLPNKLMDFQT